MGALLLPDDLYNPPPPPPRNLAPYLALSLVVTTHSDGLGIWYHFSYDPISLTAEAIEHLSMIYWPHVL